MTKKYSQTVYARNKALKMFTDNSVTPSVAQRYTASVCSVRDSPKDVHPVCTVYSVQCTAGRQRCTSIMLVVLEGVCFGLVCLALSCLALACLVLPWLALACLGLPCLVLSCLVLSCLALLSCLVLYCLVLSYCLV